jgi:glycosyltransferase involved in cell wall biosynthesis
MKISIALTTFNGARFLEEQLASFSAQTLPAGELVVCDDGSTDGTLGILERFQRTAPCPVRIERNERQLGISDNFLKAASLCQHGWVAFSDQDDVWHAEKLATVATAVRAHPGALLVAHRARLVDERLRSLGELLHVPDVRRVKVIPRMGTPFWSYPYGFTMAFDARLVRDFAYEERPVWSHDRWIFILATALGTTILLPDALASYRRHQANASQLHPQQRLSAEAIRNAAATGYAEELKVVTAVAEFFARRGSEGAAALADAAAAYHRLARHLSLRAELGRPGLGPTERARLVGRLLSAGAYRRHALGGLGWRAGLKDASRIVIG